MFVQYVLCQIFRKNQGQNFPSVPVWSVVSIFSTQMTQMKQICADQSIESLNNLRASVQSVSSACFILKKSHKIHLNPKIQPIIYCRELRRLIDRWFTVSKNGLSFLKIRKILKNKRLKGVYNDLQRCLKWPQKCLKRPTKVFRMTLKVFKMTYKGVSNDLKGV